jgi:hypothetical protein
MDVTATIGLACTPSDIWASEVLVTLVISGTITATLPITLLKTVPTTEPTLRPSPFKFKPADAVPKLLSALTPVVPAAAVPTLLSVFTIVVGPDPPSDPMVSTAGGANTGVVLETAGTDVGESTGKFSSEFVPDRRHLSSNSSRRRGLGARESERERLRMVYVPQGVSLEKKRGAETIGRGEFPRLVGRISTRPLI